MNWPVGNIEYGSLHWLRREVAVAMEYPADYALLDQTQRGTLDSVIESGTHRFYYPPPGEFTIANATEAQKERLRRAPHTWTFLQKRIPIQTELGKSRYPLPQAFAGFIDQPTTSRLDGGIAIVNESQIRQLIDASTANGVPRYCATEHSAGDGSSRPSRSLLLYPIPSIVETISIRYSITPPRLDDEHPWPISGVEHAETHLACCLAIIAERKGDTTGAARANMADRLSSSILLDQQLSVASTDGIWEDDDDSSFDRTYVQKMVGIKTGIGPNPKTWTDAQRRKIDEIIRVATRRVVNPPALPGERYPYQWKWLMPIAEMDLVQGQSEIDLPLDFAMIEGFMTIKGTDSRLSSPIRLTGEQTVRQMIEREQQSGLPRLVAIRVKEHDGQICRQAIFYPIPDADTTVLYRYRRNPERLLDKVELDVTPAPVVSLQPVNATVASSATFTFTVAAVNANSYQWQRNQGSGFENIPGATSSAYAGIAAPSYNNNTFRCIVVGPRGQVTSNAATLIVT
jgi:hypothetical protein